MVPVENFFSLDSFAPFADGFLWKPNEPVWAPLKELKSYFAQKKSYRIEIPIPPGVFLENPDLISIGEGTILEPGTYIQGPCIIGKNCRIRHGAYIRKYVLCGDDCTMGHCAEIKHSILFNGAAVTHFVYVGDSILGNGVNLGAGVKCANFRLDRSIITVRINGKKIDTGLQKLGAIIGDRVQIGCNCVLNPGTLVSKDSISYPLTTLSGFIPPGSQITPKGTKILEKLLCQSTTTAHG